MFLSAFAQVVAKRLAKRSLLALAAKKLTPNAAKIAANIASTAGNHFSLL
jgi:hypothetical protein